MSLTDSATLDAPEPTATTSNSLYTALARL